MTIRPTHQIIIKDKVNKSRKTVAGVAWMTAEGWFSIILNPGIVLTAETCTQYYINMYPAKEYEEKAKTEPSPLDAGDEDLPF